MTGLEKIIRDISEDSKTAASAVLEEARRDAEKVRARYESAAGEKCAAIRLGAEREAAAARERAEADAALRRHRAVLEEKQRIIGEIIEKARRKLYELPAEEYFGLILKIASKYALPGGGEILFSPKDLGRLPKGFEEKLNAVLPAGASLKISERTRGIDGGFVLVYGGVEENCSFSSLFDAKRDDMQDRVHALLFAEA